MEVSFKTSPEEFATISRIADRAREIIAANGWSKEKRMSLMMDITACHANGCPLRLKELLAADDINFSHDVFGIRRHLDRSTGWLKDGFHPRFARQDAPAA